MPFLEKDGHVFSSHLTLLVLFWNFPTQFFSEQVEEFDRHQHGND